MDAAAKKKAIYRAKLKAQKQHQRIESPLVRYNESDQPVCKVCDLVLKSESAWSAHQAIQTFKANAAAASKANNVKPGPTETKKPKPELPAESKSQMGLPQARSGSALPSNFFDKPDTKRQQNETTKAKLVGNDKMKTVLGSAQAQVTHTPDGENKRVAVSSAKVAETVGDDTRVSQSQSIPENFFDDKDSDQRARGITPVKLNIKDEYKEFEKLIQEDLKEVDNRLEEEEYDAAEMIEEAETVEQKSCRERVELFKRKKLELKAARSGKRNKVSQVVEKESSSDESSSDEDSDDAVDWRAKHL
uniref:Zinc finger protein 830 n=1 Tax=Tanacetum cinerariifolium TaxID=118510 RepID=A0A6L2N4C6_TANCI|nr:zinc finger protein 830 [Tanacetum cinerariifolium]